MPTEPKNNYALKIAVNDQRMAATRQLYISACLADETELMERYRLEMQSLLDCVLDDTYHAMREIRNKLGS